MRIDKPILHLMAREAITEIVQSGGKLEDGDELWLHTLACRVSQNADLIELSAWLDVPVRCGPLEFRTPSIAAEQWIDQCAEPWFGGDKRWEVIAIAYILVHGRDPDVFAKLNTESSARSAIRRWMWTIPLTFRQLAVGVDEYFAKREAVEVKTVKESEELDIRKHWGFVIPWLVRYYGGTEQDWLYRKSSAIFREMVNGLPQVMQSEAEKDTKFGRFSEFREAVCFIKRGRVAA